MARAPGCEGRDMRDSGGVVAILFTDLVGMPIDEALSLVASRLRDDG